MERTQQPSRGRLVRTALAVGLAVAALSSVRKGKRLRGVLTGLGAVALGYSAWSAADGGVVDVVGPVTGEPAAAAGGLRCANCGEPIVAGQSRVPNADGETVHEDCLEASA